MNTNWKYTAAEKRAIHDAYDEIAYTMDATGHREPHRLREALKMERRCRSCITAAKALLVNGFAEGMRENPTASTLAGFSEGIAVAVILGADYGRRRNWHGIGVYDPTPADRERLPNLLAASAAAHDAYLARGMESIRSGVEPAGRDWTHRP